MALVKPHGSRGELLPLVLSGKNLAAERKRAAKLRQVSVSSREAGDILMLGMGAFSPLPGFMGRVDYEGCLSQMQLRQSDPGVLWPLPVTLAVEEPLFEKDEEIALVFGETLLATMIVQEVWRPDKKKECELCFMGQGSVNRDDFWLVAEEEHPGVRQVMEAPPFYAGGPVKVLSEGDVREKYGANFFTPQEARLLFEELGWTTVAAFQTRHPIYRSQEYLCKIAQELVDGLFIHAVMGHLRADEIPGEIRIECYRALLSRYFSHERTLLGVYPMDMRYGGPREALLHAIIRQNFGCSHLLVGRDHAGVGDFYGIFEAQAIFDTLWEGALAIQPLKVDWAFWSIRNQGMATLKTCPTDDPQDRIMLSGSKFHRLMLEERADLIPPEFARPEVVEVLRNYYAGLRKEV